jgi:hypothetical protein
MDTLKAVKVAKWFLEHWIYRYGLPCRVVVDGGTMIADVSLGDKGHDQ